MFILFSLITSRNIINVHKIENLNTTVVLIYDPNSQIDRQNFNEYCQSIQKFFHKEFPQMKFTNLSHSEWMKTYNIHLSKKDIILALFRNNNFVEFYQGIIDGKSIRKYLTLAELSHVILIEENDIPFILKTKKRFFIFHNDHIYFEYENTAFEYKNTDITFYFVKGPFSLFFYDNPNHQIRQYDFTKKITTFIKSCAATNQEKMNDDDDTDFPQEIAQLKDNFKKNAKNLFSFYAITDSLHSNQTINYYLSSLNRSIYKYGKSSIINWSNSISKKIQRLCLIRPNQLTYSLLYHYNKTSSCWFYPFETITNQELFNNFFISAIQNTLLETMVWNDVKQKGQENTPKRSSKLLRLIPNRVYIIVALISNSKSMSQNSIYESYFLLKYRLSYFKKIKFVEISEAEYQNFPFYFPDNDGFPMIILWEPRNRFPHIFLEPLSNDNLIKFVLKYVKRNL